SQNNNTKTTTLECEVIVNGFRVPATIDSEAATSIISEKTIEQLQYDIEEATNCKIILVNGEKNESLGRIRDFPIEIEGKTIPINVEVMKTEVYHILLGND
ncbi:1570_t:CDS:1, partial [Dentiscutata erythropus]